MKIVTLIAFLLFPVVCFADEVRVQVLIQEDVDVKGQIISFTDALYYPFSDYPSIDPAQIDQERKDRIDNFKSAIENVPLPVEPTKDELIAQKVALEEELAAIPDKITELDAKIAEADVVVKDVADDAGGAVVTK